MLVVLCIVICSMFLREKGQGTGSDAGAAAAGYLCHAGYAVNAHPPGRLVAAPCPDPVGFQQGMARATRGTRRLMGVTSELG